MSLRYLFVDMNAYFASVEQQMRPELRGRPVAVVPVMTDSTCCIAASYEAKRFGVKTGTMVREARRLCPKLHFAVGRHHVYVRVHHAIREAVERVMPVAAVHSIDEVSCRLMANQNSPETAAVIGGRIKERIRCDVGEYLRCSVGIGPNCFLAKVAADMEKPDGLTIVRLEDLPLKLHGLKLDDLPGIGPRMLRRLQRQGVDSVRQLCTMSEKDMERLWGSVVGRRFWYSLHGHDLPGLPTRRRTVGHSHVLSPEYRSEPAAHAVLARLLCKAAGRMRRLGYAAGRLDVYVIFLQGGFWQDGTAMTPCQDTASLLGAFTAIWARRDVRGVPLKVGLVLSRLLAAEGATLPLFPAERKLIGLSRAMDCINARYGRETVHLGTIHQVLDSAPTRIAFTNIPELDDPANFDPEETAEAWRLAPASNASRTPEAQYEQDEFSQDAFAEESRPL